MKSNTNNSAGGFEFDDVQSLIRFGNARLVESCFLLLKIADVLAAREWLASADISTALLKDELPEQIIQIAFSAQGMKMMQLSDEIIEGFSDEFIVGMQGDESRSRRLGDIGENHPQQWDWGGSVEEMPHIVLLLYSIKGGLTKFRQQLEDDHFITAFEVSGELPTDELGVREPFGFVDGISQPRIDWEQKQSTDIHQRDQYSNWLVPGEVVLGYRNEYGLYTPRPLVDAEQDELALNLPQAEDEPGLRDLGRNGSYLVIRQLHQDVIGFWKTVHRESDLDPHKADELAASMVGRKRDGSPLISSSQRLIPGISRNSINNQFNYDLDPDGIRCPVSSHIRRSNPRTGDYPPDVNGFLSRMIRLAGFGQKRPDDDLIASSRFHRLLRRGRSYGPRLHPEDAIRKGAEKADRGLEFMCLVGNINRQFEFVQNAWIMNSKFAGLKNERDPLTGTREPLINGAETDKFKQPTNAGPSCITHDMAQFVTVRGGGYFFMPGIRALRYIARVKTKKDGDSV